MEREKWTSEEMVLTLYIYLTHNPEELHKYSKFMIDFCNRLNNFTEKKRTTSSIEMRISNYKSVDPNYKKTGLANGGRSVLEYWTKYHSNIKYMSDLYDKFVSGTMKPITNESIEELNEIIKEFKMENIEDKDSYVESIINLRNGAIQGIFKENLIIEFNQKCAICSVNKRELLIASHILPYSLCEKKEDMINHNNGLLLCPMHDALFDKKLISFDSKGKILINKNLGRYMYTDLNINDTVVLDSNYLNEERKKFLKNHNSKFEEKNEKN